MGIKTKYKNIIANKVKQSYVLKLKTNRLLLHSCLIHRNNKLKIFVFLVTALFSISSFSQEIKFKEYSYTQFMELIQNEKDSVFKLSNAIVKYNPATDKDFISTSQSIARFGNQSNKKQSITISKAIVLDNVQFIEYQDFNRNVIAGLHHIIFEEDVKIENSFVITLNNCVFKKRFEFANYEYFKFSAAKNKHPQMRGRVYIYNNEFLGSVLRIINSSTLETKRNFAFIFSGNTVAENCDNIFIASWELQSFQFSNNIFNSKDSYFIQIEQMTGARIENNQFNKGVTQFFCIEIDELTFKDNEFLVPSIIDFKASNNVNFIGANQFKSNFVTWSGYADYKQRLEAENPDISFWNLDKYEETLNNYYNKERIENLTSYQFELDQLSVFYNHFKERHNTAEANKYYIDIKDLESKRLEYEHNLNPTFTTFFKIQINKFLKLFSNYGTEPERAVLVSIYVILIFALIYLLFPNSWDKHGKNRIMDRYRFFTKYMNRDAGIHEVYLEEQKEELLESEEFKNYMLSAEKTIPSFFLKTAMPLYKWSISGMKFSASLLKRVDVMKGTWQNVPEKRRPWKTILLVGAFSVALLYDVTIKILNALMLSINTFTTLGFGEIPIKGLPRYLAIIQGFIGWFMLTIFSVSLISQLLN